MTSIAIWTGVDSRGPASLHIASDSRVSWNGTTRWDHCLKTFASARSPDIFSYCGDALYASLLLSQFVALLDSGLSDRKGSDRFATLETIARETFASYPSSTTQLPFTLVHCSRDGEGMKSTFVMHLLHWTPARGWSRGDVAIPSVSSQLILTLGSGRGSVEAATSRWTASTSGGTSRAVFTSFVSAIQSGDDPASGGSPQLVSLFRVGNGRASGTILASQRYFGGIPIADDAVSNEIIWFNEYFELCDGISMKRKEGAQIHEKRP
jgi:hypothetical protein